MIRELQVISNKHRPAQYTAGEALTRGMAVYIDYSASGGAVVKAASGASNYLVDVAPNYDGINAVVEPTDGSFETIASGAKVILIPTFATEAYATTEVTLSYEESSTAKTLAVGDKLTASSGKLVHDSTGDFVYDGTYSDATGKTMYRVVKA